MRVLSVEKELTKETVLSTYEDVFKGLCELPGKHHIRIDKTATPVIHTPRKVPAALRDAVITELDRMETLGVIAKQDEPTDSLVTVRKSNRIRVCIDPKDMNCAIKREHYHLQVQLRNCPKRKYLQSSTRLMDSGKSNLISPVQSY